MSILGIDIGGSGIKAAPVDLDSGRLIEERYRIPTPDPSTPEAVADVIARLAAHFSWTGPVGCAFPAVVKHGVTLTAANVDDSWVGCDAARLFGEQLDVPVTLINDADAAGLAEMHFGAGRDHEGTVIMLTLGTGIGSAVFTGGRLVPNTEFGHMDIGGKEAEALASDRIRKAEDLSWRRWARRLSQVLQSMEALFRPDLFILGGGVSKKHGKFLDAVECATPVVPATLKNEAGIVGAALAARR